MEIKSNNVAEARKPGRKPTIWDWFLGLETRKTGRVVLSCGKLLNTSEGTLLLFEI